MIHFARWKVALVLGILAVIGIGFLYATTGTLNMNDIAERLEQGFRMIIVTSPDAIAVGKRAAGR